MSVHANPFQATANDLKLMFKAYRWPNKVRPHVFESIDVQAVNVVPDRSLIITVGMLRGVERTSGVLANRPVMLAQLTAYAYSGSDVTNIIDDVFTCIFKTLDDDTPTPRLWYVSRRFSSIEKIVPAQTRANAVRREHIRQEFFRQDMFAGLYIKP
jgi:hypothetical protein